MKLATRALLIVAFLLLATTGYVIGDNEDMEGWDSPSGSRCYSHPEDAPQQLGALNYCGGSGGGCTLCVKDLNGDGEWGGSFGEDCTSSGSTPDDWCDPED